MKRIVLLILVLSQTGIVGAQYYPSGTAYLQDFDGLVNGLPNGWHVYIGGTDTSTGQEDMLVAGTSSWGHSGAGFKNFASANGLPSTTPAADQHTASDRALGVRQTTAAGYNPGAAFVFRMANTTGLSDFRLSFRLQTLTSSAHSIEWTVDYALGDTPTAFIPIAATGNLTTGNSAVSNNVVDADFGNALDNHAGIVWIRIVNLHPSIGGSGARPSIAIDDFSLTWTGAGSGSGRPEIQNLTPPNGAVNVSLQTVPQIWFSHQVQKGSGGNLYITDETSGRSDTIPVGSAQVVVDGHRVSFEGYNWMPASVYHIMFDSMAFDTAGKRAYGIYDTSSWRFTTAPEVHVVSSLYEMFDEACTRNELPLGWTRINKKGTQQWGCHTAYGITSYRITAYASGKYHENEDWLITPRIDRSAATRTLWFRQYKRRAGTELQVLTSADYPGYGDPDEATWSDLAIPMDASDTLTWLDFTVDLSAIPESQFFIAFKYTASSVTGYEIRIDSVVVAARQTSVSDLDGAYGQPRMARTPGGGLNLWFSVQQAGIVAVCIYDLAGRAVYRWDGYTPAGEQRHLVLPDAWPSGIYIVSLTSEHGHESVVKAVVH